MQDGGIRARLGGTVPSDQVVMLGAALARTIKVANRVAVGDRQRGVAEPEDQQGDPQAATTGLTAGPTAIHGETPHKVRRQNPT